MILFAIFALVPIIEIALFIQVGGLIGLWPTLAIVVGTAILGSKLMRSQGRQAMQRLQMSFSEMRDPTEPLVHGAMILVAGMLLLTPGFFTDTLGLLLLVPQFREAAFAALRARVNVQSYQFSTRNHSYGATRPGQGDIIDGDFEDVTPNARARTGPSKWVDQTDQNGKSGQH